MLKTAEWDSEKDSQNFGEKFFENFGRCVGKVWSNFKEKFCGQKANILDNHFSTPTPLKGLKFIKNCSE